MQDLSFDFRDPIWNFNGFHFSIEVFTYENVYGLDPSQCIQQLTDADYLLTCSRLTWAGGQEQAEGDVTLRACILDGKTQFELHAGCKKTIRCVKLTIKGVPTGQLANLREGKREIPEAGLLFKYPDGWRGLDTPLVVIQTGERGFTYFRSLDTRVREKRFTLLPRSEKLDVELIFEELVENQSDVINTPTWEIGITSSLDEIMLQQTDFIQQSYGLLPWETRPDVPEWGRQLGLVAAINCQHWTGYIFNDYDAVVQKMRWLAERFDPRRTLIYLPGWEGRYYWQYGDYRPDPRLGGEKGFEQLMLAAKSLGTHIMPMFGINVVNKGIENYEQWGAPAVYHSAGGYRAGGSVDWDSSRHYDHGWGSLLNPGAPTWQNRLVGQVSELVERFGFEGVYLDISAAWWNDPKHNMVEGTRRLVQRIQDQCPGVLIAGEGWYDGISSITPLVQSGHSDGPMNWHDQPYPEFFDRFCRSFAHLCLGDPGRGSTGVHELGYNTVQRCPIRKGIIPTITIVEDTFEKAPEKVEQILNDAREYCKLFLK